MGAGQHITLRTWSPQPPSDVISASLIAWIELQRSPFSTPWSWKSWRVVIRIVPLPHSSAMRSWAR